MDRITYTYTNLPMPFRRDFYILAMLNGVSAISVTYACSLVAALEKLDLSNVGWIDV